jgi:undecaprenol kinase
MKEESTPHPFKATPKPRRASRVLVRRYLRQLGLFKGISGGKESKGFAAPNFLASVNYALEGLWFALKMERNLRIDAYLVCGAFILAAQLGLGLEAWAVLLQMMGFVLFAELANTVVEWLVDLLTNGAYDIRAKRIKDIAAAACLIVALVSYGVAGILLLPKLIERFYLLWCWVQYS